MRVGVVEATRAERIADWREQRVRARAVGDMGLVRMVDAELARMGALETPEPPEMERAVPPKPKRGRKPLPRCEHEMIAARCPTCSPEDQVA